ncbi:DUF4282 domain-containing protein [Actinomadura napierensis]|uniref:DUF4282 domain-containing protein n=1 Tax=Actinomadura napierensis TaxID=267854 RepID=UPI0031D3107A
MTYRHDLPPHQPPRRDSLIAALLDVKFERRVTPILVRWLYVLALVVIGFGTLFALLWVWSLASWMGWAMWLAAPIVVGLGLAVLLVIRIICERIISKTQPVPPPAPPPYAPPVQPPHVHRP